MIMFPSSLFLKQSLNQKIVLEPRGIYTFGEGQVCNFHDKH